MELEVILNILNGRTHIIENDSDISIREKLIRLNELAEFANTLHTRMALLEEDVYED